MTSHGFRTKSPTNFTTLVNANMNTNCVQKAYLRFVISQSPVAHQHDASRSGSVTNASEVNVAIWRAYVHHGCWLREELCQLIRSLKEHETCRRWPLEAGIETFAKKVAERERREGCTRVLGCWGAGVGIGLHRINSRQHVTLASQTCPVTPPVAPCPAGALKQELGPVFQSGFDLTFALVLDPCLPLVAD